MIVRSRHFSFDVPGCDAAIATLYYQGDDSTLAEARLTGIVGPEPSTEPYPIVVLMPGINVAPDSYRWLAVRLVEAGFAAVTYAAIGSLGPAGRGITPGLDMAALAPDVIGTRCSASAIEPILSALGSIEDQVLRDSLDLGRVVLGGHSAAGTVSLHNSTGRWVPGLRCVFSYAGHTMTSTSLGYGERSVVPVPAEVPVLLLAGELDGVIAASRDRYGGAETAHDPVELTFAEGINRNEGDSWFIELVGGNHFTICHPVDETSGRSFLESDLDADFSSDNGGVDSGQAPRDLLADLIVAFASRHCLVAAASGQSMDRDIDSMVAGLGVARRARK